MAEPTRTSTGNHWWDVAKPYVEICGVALLAIYTGFTIAIYSANKKSADAAESAATTASNALSDARKNFLAEQRPILWLTNDIGEPKVFTNPKDPSEGQILWTWHYTNYGKTPPKKITFEHYFKFDDVPPVPSYGAAKINIAAPIPPGKVDFATVVSSLMKVTEISTHLKQGQVGIIVVIKYTDVYDVNYETGICLQRTNAGSITYCRDGNYIN